ncbi:hypothetical protein SDC9_126038 [bioreactor metagenome]|uniref:Uncharacterized protein n=1 Tax=bioreactor metagenome TaxID=1076179 RepID=A0A645CQM5_9ZZZZ
MMSLRELVCKWSIAWREIFEAVALPALLSWATTDTSFKRNELCCILKVITVSLPGAIEKVVSIVSIPRKSILTLILPGESLPKVNSPLVLVVETDPWGSICTVANSTGTDSFPSSTTFPFNVA